MKWEKREGEDYGYDITEWDLPEISAVPVPSNLDTGEKQKLVKAWEQDYREGAFGEVPVRILQYFGITEKRWEEEKEKGDKIDEDDSSLETAENKGDQSAVEVISFPVLPAVEKEVISFPVA